MCGDFINHEKVQLCVVFLISLNAIMMGIATFDFVSENPSASKVFETTDTIFLSIFTVELVMQLIYHGPRLFLDGWLVFDFVIIILSWALSSLQIIRAFRIFRALRLVNRIKVMRNLVLALGSDLVRRDAHADARPADQDASVHLALVDPAGDLVGVVGVVNALLPVSAGIDRLVPLLP